MEFIGLFFLVLLAPFAAVFAALLWERDRWLFDGVPWYWMLLAVPAWLFLTLWRGLWSVDTVGAGRAN